MVVTNVPGPRQPIYLAGTRVRGVLVWAPTSGSVAHERQHPQLRRPRHGRRHGGRDLVPDPGRIADGFERELGRLRRAYLPAAGPRARAAKRRRPRAVKP